MKSKGRRHPLSIQKIFCRTSYVHLDSDEHHISPNKASTMLPIPLKTFIFSSQDTDVLWVRLRFCTILLHDTPHHKLLHGTAGLSVGVLLGKIGPMNKECCASLKDKGQQETGGKTNTCSGKSYINKWSKCLDITIGTIILIGRLVREQQTKHFRCWEWRCIRQPHQELCIKLDYASVATTRECELSDI